MPSYHGERKGRGEFDETLYAYGSRIEAWHKEVQDLVTLLEEAQPTAFHRYLEHLAVSGQLLRVYTMNIDGLETRLPSLKTHVPLDETKRPLPKLIQLHGSLHTMYCQSCGYNAPTDKDLFVGPYPPDCTSCVEMIQARRDSGRRQRTPGGLRVRVLMYQHLPDALDTVAIGRILQKDVAKRPDLFLVAGVSARHEEVKKQILRLCDDVRQANGQTIWINKELPPGPLLKAFDWILQGPCDELARFAVGS